MTEEDRDAMEGRVNRELREAQAALNELLVKAEQTAVDINSLATEITSRIKRARFAGAHVEEPMRNRSYVQADAGIEHGKLQLYEKAVNLAAIEALDRQISQAVARLIKARQQKQELGV